MSSIIEIISDNEIYLTSIVGVAVSFLSIVISIVSRRKQEEITEVQKQVITAIIEEPDVTSKVSGISDTYIYWSKEFEKEELKDNIELAVIEKLKESHDLSESNVREKVNTELNLIETRLKQIEERFPDKSNIEKIASINDAIFAERLETYSKQIEDIESKILSKWDVAIIVSTIIGGIFAIVGATYGVIVFIQATGTTS